MDGRGGRGGSEWGRFEWKKKFFFLIFHGVFGTACEIQNRKREKEDEIKKKKKKERNGNMQLILIRTGHVTFHKVKTQSFFFPVKFTAANYQRPGVVQIHQESFSFALTRKNPKILGSGNPFLFFLP